MIGATEQSHHEIILELSGNCKSGTRLAVVILSITAQPTLKKDFSHFFNQMYHLSRAYNEGRNFKKVRGYFHTRQQNFVIFDLGPIAKLAG